MFYFRLDISMITCRNPLIFEIISGKVLGLPKSARTASGNVSWLQNLRAEQNGIEKTYGSCEHIIRDSELRMFRS